MFLCRALDIRVNAVGRDHPAVAQTLTSFGSFLMRLEEYDRSLEMFTEALAISEVCHGCECVWECLSQHSKRGQE